METVVPFKNFLDQKYTWLPESIKSDIGHFNVFQMEPFDVSKIKPLPYRRRDYFKIMLVIGDLEMHYADGVIPINGQALVFSNPLIPYHCQPIEQLKGGFYCIFDEQFFHQFGDLNQYEVFQPTENHVFDLTLYQVEQLSAIYQKMFAEINSDYQHKYDVLRNLVYEILHFAVKMRPSEQQQKQPKNAAQRIGRLFLELLERQFPIDEDHPIIKLRTASDFATQLNVHVNHLNKSLKTITEKTTSQIIADRITQESKTLLKHSHWNVSEIAFALGFSEVTHFNNFFKKHVHLSPSKFKSHQNNLSKNDT